MNVVFLRFKVLQKGDGTWPKDGVPSRTWYDSTYKLTMTLLQPVTLDQLIKQIGADPRMVPQYAIGDPHWRVCVPVPSVDIPLASSKFFRSLSTDVDDAAKKGAFLQNIHAIYSSASMANFESLLRTGAVISKTAHPFRYKNKSCKISEVKSNKKDRIYYFSLLNPVPSIVLLLAHHKNTQKTPDFVAEYSERIYRDLM